MVGIVATVAVVLGAWYYDRIPIISSTKAYSAYFAEAGGLRAGAEVQVAGMPVGKVEKVSLDGRAVIVSFTVDKSIRIGELSEAAVKTKSLLGTKYLSVTPRGDGDQSAAIPLQRTTPAYQLPDALGDLTVAISGLDTDQLSESLQVLADTFRGVSTDLGQAMGGIARFSKTLNIRDTELRNLLTDARKATAVLSERSNQIVNLVGDTNELLEQLLTQRKALDSISVNVARASRQLSSFVSENRAALRPAVDKLNGVLETVDRHRSQIQEWISRFSDYAMALGESVSSGPFFKAYIVNLLPGQFVQPFVDAAFSDLGLDPNVLLPAERTDPQVGQPGTPPLPVPYPRTGQAGEPRMSLPEAISGNVGDQPCGLSGAPLPGPGCYPFREPGPAPAPGGPPPGPPAEDAASPQPAPSTESSNPLEGSPGQPTSGDG